VICGADGIPVFDRLRYGRQPQTEAVLFAFDLIELAGNDLRRTPIEERKRELAMLLRRECSATSPSPK
jgi:bifunctional non-homologous end joining protein LigD